MPDAGTRSERLIFVNKYHYDVKVEYLIAYT